MTTPNNEQPPKWQRITPENPPQFPCWLKRYGSWSHHNVGWPDLLYALKLDYRWWHLAQHDSPGAGVKGEKT